MKTETLPAPQMTEDEFLEMEAASTEKHEFVGGRVRLYNAPYGEEYMAGASLSHNELADTLRALLFIYLKQSHPTHFAYGSDMMVAADESGLKTYPDITIASRPLTFIGKGRRVIGNAEVVVEVLSETTMRYDLTEKLAAYQQHPTLKQVVYLDSQVVMALSYLRNPAGGWDIDGPYTQLTSALQIHSIGFTVKLDELYGSLLERGEVKL